ncbi:beta family protein [Sulfitobacter pacificus]|uniref:beta family protein n=1 Tax=Sulfitobacter pacificus TaxID=1499314 RepID=UPI00310A1EEB
MSENYFLLFKTADAEKRAWRNLASERKEALFPIVELTRGKKKPKVGKDKDGKQLPADQLRALAGIYGFESNYRSTMELMSPCSELFVDITREPSLSCYETDQLGRSDAGYSAWVDFVVGLHGTWENVLPTLIINPSEDEDEATYVKNVEDQFDAFAAKFTKMAYRVSILEDPDFIYDIALLKERIQAFTDEGGTFFVVLDHEYIRPRNGHIHSKRTSAIITSLVGVTDNVKIVCLATSFPKSVTDIGEEDFDSFPVEEAYLYDMVKKDHPHIQYGDYGSINPIRNDEIIITQGWRPRIDYVSSYEGLSVYYYREKRLVLGKNPATNKNILAPYPRHYTSVASKVRNRFPYYQVLNHSWGCQEIEDAANGSVPSNSPSHWISVRMEIHIIRILQHLGLDVF